VCRTLTSIVICVGGDLNQAQDIGRLEYTEEWYAPDKIEILAACIAYHSIVINLRRIRNAEAG
jgi:hypothetical protein